VIRDSILLKNPSLTEYLRENTLGKKAVSRKGGIVKTNFIQKNSSFIEPENVKRTS